MPCSYSWRFRLPFGFAQPQSLVQGRLLNQRIVDSIFHILFFLRSFGLIQKNQKIKTSCNFLVFLQVGSAARHKPHLFVRSFGLIQKNQKIKTARNFLVFYWSALHATQAAHTHRPALASVSLTQARAESLPLKTTKIP